MSHLLEVENLHVQFGGVKALDGASVYLDVGEIVALLGPNGAGKSTILKSIFGIAPLKSGKIFFEGEVLNSKPHEVVSLGISFVPQGKRVFKNLSVEENLEIVSVHLPDKAVLKHRIHEMYELFPILKDKRKQPSGSLSGGQQQLLAIARGLITQPRVLLLDEPTLGLAPKVVKEVFEKIAEVNQKQKTAIFVVEHNLKSLLQIVDRAYVLSQGTVVAEGDGSEIIHSGILEKVFLAN
ncbi:MAG TPA: ABC transporter ATP-binding protein [Patescibacteria group bacterium]|nr:ABC transporter ATP-binding protein [Patescibacteria group bacterium]